LVSQEASLKRIAFTQIGGRGWMGGLNYQVNLLSTLIANESLSVKPVLFLGCDADQAVLKQFQQIQGLEIVQTAVFDQKNKNTRLVKALFFGIDTHAFRQFKQYGIDVVFEVASFYGWRFPIKSIAWIPDLQHRQLRHYFGFLAYWKREIGFRMQILTGRHIMVSSHDAREDFQRFYSILQHKLHVVRFAVPVVPRIYDMPALLTRYQLPEHFFYLPNQFWRHKNHECIIRALAIAKQEGHELVVVMTGNTDDPRDPEYFPGIVALAEELGVKENIRILGLIPYEDVQSLMISCDALINPSRFEGWSTTVEEAKALGVNMILSDINVHREQAGEHAEYFDVNDASQLSRILISYVERPMAQKVQQTPAATERANIRMREFATAFADMVGKVAG
jgi:glycosyltransferase involved in cell wall biosynthesis